jgi:hypothetical protein
MPPSDVGVARLLGGMDVRKRRAMRLREMGGKPPNFVSNLPYRGPSTTITHNPYPPVVLPLLTTM